MINQLKYEFYILNKRGKIQKTLIGVTIVISLFSVLLFAGKNVSFWGNIYEYSFLINDESEPFMFLLILLIPLFTSFSHADVSHAEGTMLYQSIIKSGSFKYYAARLIVNFICGFVVVLYALLLTSFYQVIMMGNATTFLDGSIAGNINYYLPSVSHDFFLVDVLLRHPQLYFAFYLVLLCFYGGSMAVLSYSLSLVLNTSFLIYISSLIFTIVVTFSMHLCHQIFHPADPMETLLPIPPIYFDGKQYSVYFGMFFWTIGLVIIGAILVYVVNYSDRESG